MTARGEQSITPAELWFLAGGLARFLGMLGLVAVGAQGQGSGFGGLGLALLAVGLVDGAPLLVVAAISVAAFVDRRWSERRRHAWRIVLVAAAASVDIAWLVSADVGPKRLGALAYLPFLFDPVVAFLAVSRADRRGAGWYLMLCATAVAVLFTASAVCGAPLLGTCS